MNWEQGHYGVNHVSVKYKILFFKTMAYSDQGFLKPFIEAKETVREMHLKFVNRYCYNFFSPQFFI